MNPEGGTPKTALKKKVAVAVVAVVILGVGIALAAALYQSSRPNRLKDLGIRSGSLQNMQTGSLPVDPKSPFSKILQLKSSDYTTLANKCVGAPTNRSQVAATIAKIDKSAKNVPKDLPSPTKTFANFYVINFGPSIPASAKCKDQSVQRQFTDLTNRLQQQINQALKSASTSSDLFNL